MKSPRPGHGERRGVRLAIYFAGFGLALVLPALVFVAYLLSLFAGLERSRYEEMLGASADGIVAGIDRELSNSITTLRVLSISYLLETGRLGEFHAQVSRSLGGSNSYVLLLDLHGQQLLNTRVPFGTELGVTGDPESVTETIERRGPYISNLFLGRVATRFVFNVTSPLVAGGEVERMLVLTRDAAELAEWLDGDQVAAGTTITLVDRKGQAMAQVPEGGLAAGSMLPSELQDLLDSPAATAYRPGPDGEEELIVTRKSAFAGWSVMLQVPRSVIDQTIDRSWLLLAAGGLGLLALTAALSLVVGRALARPIQRLARDARAFGRGRAVPRRHTVLREVNQVSEALARAASERGRQLAHVEILMKELAHRSKNQLAIIQSLARLVGRRAGSIQAFQASFLPRLEGLARSIDALTSQDWKGARVHELVTMQLAPFMAEGRPRFSLEGPDLMIKPMAVQRLGLALHELATNAAKYGAWSNAVGHVHFSLQVDADDEPPTVRLVWRETGGPPAAEPAEVGFGRTLIDDMLRSTLAAEIDIAFPVEGFIWELRCTLAELSADAEDAQGDTSAGKPD